MVRSAVTRVFDALWRLLTMRRIEERGLLDDSAFAR